MSLYTPPRGTPTPSADALAHSAALVNHIQKNIQAQQGKITFAEFMQMALYDPKLGYYRSGLPKIGSDGDFVTAPELSPLFSFALARQCHEILNRLGGGDILELGAGSGQMALDLLRALEKNNALPHHYFILEISGELRERQQKKLQTFAPKLAERVTWLTRLPEALTGIILANEVVDALPVNRFCLVDNEIKEYYVGFENESFVWITDAPSSPAFFDHVQRIQQTFLPNIPLTPQDAQPRILRCEGYSTHYASEVNLQASAWLHSLSDSLVKGAILLLDYGFSDQEYYHPQRTEGTLMCHYRHRAHTDPLILVGLQDITAHVDFSLLAESALRAGLTVSGYTTQANFLIGCGILQCAPEPTQLNQQLAISQQLQTLLMPHEMGELVKALLLTKGIDGDFMGF
jgi:Uncharacterized conserved protein